MTCFEDIESWLIEFLRKFVLSRESDVHVFRTAGSSIPKPDLNADGEKELCLPYEVIGLNVQAWRTPDEARSYLSVFAPPDMTSDKLEYYFQGIEAALKAASSATLAPISSAKRKTLHKETVEPNAELKKMMIALSQCKLQDRHLLSELAGRESSTHEDHGKQNPDLHQKERKRNAEI